MDKKIIIVGGGFGGIRAALECSKYARVVLISNKPHHEYTPALYRVVTGRSPLEVCIPLRDIFQGTSVEVLEDTIVSVDLKKKKLKGISNSQYTYDFLVLALGSESSYFNIPGLEQFSYGFKSIAEALTLKRHFHELFTDIQNAPHDVQVPATHVAIVGGGASGTELAGELATYCQKLARMHGLDPSLITIDLFEAGPRLVPSLPESMARRIEDRLRHLGVNIFFNRSVIKEDIEAMYLKDMEIRLKTVIWTAGVKPHRLYAQTKGFQYDKKGRIIVDEWLQAKGLEGVFIIGDGASTLYAGMAQTAIHNGHFIGKVIGCMLRGNVRAPYVLKKPLHATPIGRGWAAVLIGNWEIYKKLGWYLRRIGDLRYFLSILPFKKAIDAFQSGKTLCESCRICSPEGQ